MSNKIHQKILNLCCKTMQDNKSYIRVNFLEDIYEYTCNINVLFFKTITIREFKNGGFNLELDASNVEKEDIRIFVNSLFNDYGSDSNCIDIKNVPVYDFFGAESYIWYFDQKNEVIVEDDYYYAIFFYYNERVSLGITNIEIENHEYTNNFDFLKDIRNL